MLLAKETYSHVVSKIIMSLSVSSVLHRFLVEQGTVLDLTIIDRRSTCEVNAQVAPKVTLKINVVFLVSGNSHLLYLCQFSWFNTDLIIVFSSFLRDFAPSMSYFSLCCFRLSCKHFLSQFVVTCVNSSTHKGFNPAQPIKTLFIMLFTLCC